MTGTFAVKMAESGFVRISSACRFVSLDNDYILQLPWKDKGCNVIEPQVFEPKV